MIREPTTSVSVVPHWAHRRRFKAAVVLRAGEYVSHQRAESRAALDELNHTRGNRAAKKTTAIETARDARGEFEVGGKCFANSRGIVRCFARDQRFREQIARTQRIIQPLAGDRINPGGGIPHQGPVAADDAARRKRLLLR